MEISFTLHSLYSGRKPLASLG